MTEYNKVYEARKGLYYDEKHYTTIIKNDAHGIYPNGKTLFRFIKNAIPKENRQKYKDAIRQPAKSKTKNRGQAVGPCHLSKFPEEAVELCNSKGEVYTDGKDRYSVYYKKANGEMVKRCQSNICRSGVAGYFDAVAGFPCRMVGWSKNNLTKTETLGELAVDIQNNHEKYEKESFDYHKKEAEKSPEFLFNNSIYSTMTLNYDFRTACHKDYGDLEGGLSTLTIFEDEENNYEGSYLGLPEYKIAFDLRDGDTLIFNAHEFHANTEMKVLTDKLPIDDLTNNNFGGRMSVVCYLRNRLSICDQELVYAIPTYQRYEKLLTHTLTFLSKHKIKTESIYIFIRNGDNDYDKYKSLESKGYKVISCDARGAGQKHNFITDYFKEGRFVIELDDDIKELINEQKKPIDNFKKDMKKMIEIMKKENINYGGIYQCDNDLFMRGIKNKYTRDLRYMLGVLRVRRICKDIKVITNYAEDFEFCLRHFVRDGKILKNNHIGPRTSLYADGGNKANGRNIETEKKDKEIVNNLYPTLSKLYQRKNGIWDLKLREYKTNKKSSSVQQVQGA